MKQSIKLIAGLILFLAVAATATLLVIKYFDILASIALDLKEKISAKKTALFSTTMCCDDEDDDLSFDDIDFGAPKEDA
ncbi:MAG: hypothetical protein FWG93_07675 [Oscillospiraceae bacterium]|nr:hypothetical protein [Oscillospiraceae bacterium]